MTKKNIMPVAVLTAICVAVAALLGLVNVFTDPVIKEMEAQKVYDSFRVVLDGTFEEVEIPEGAASTVTAVYKVTEGDALKGHVVTLTTKGYAGDISLTVGVGADGKITKAVITNQSETHGKSGMSTYTDAYAGLGATEAAGVDTFTGATVSSTAIKGAIVDAVNAITGSSVEAPEGDGGSAEQKPAITSPKSDSEVIAIAGELIPGATGFTEDTETQKPYNLIKLYKVEGEGGYAAYIVVPGAYVPVATEAVLYINNDGDIEGIRLLTWTVGHGVGAGDFANRFIGKDVWHIGEVELVSGATGTSADFQAAVAEALNAITAKLDMTDKKLYELADEMIPGARGFEKIELPTDAPETLKALLREKGDKGYVAYVLTTGWGGIVATEALVYFDRWGEIKDVNLLTWTVGHGYEPGSFPQSFIGRTEKDIDEVELITGATGTSGDLKTAIAAVYPYLPESFPTPVVCGAVILVLAIAAFVVCTVISRKRRAIK